MYRFMVKWGIALALIGFSMVARAQKPTSLVHEDRDFRKGMELFEREKYTAAQPYFRKVFKRIPNRNMEMHVDAKYMEALSALRLYHRDTEHLMSNFIKKYPDSKWVVRANYELARYSFQRKKYEKALQYFDRVTERDIEPDEVTEYRFKKGYSHYREDQLDAAHNLFYLVKDSESDYRAPAAYYYAHIAYERGNYQVALESMQAIQNDEAFARIVPYYIAQIYFMQERYDELLDYAPALLDTARAQKAADISKLIGVAYFKKEMYKESVPYLTTHYQRSGRRNRDDAYQLGYALYRSGDYEEALRRFSEVREEDDLLSQTTAYHMGHCYLELDQKQYARNAFEAAASYMHDQSITEDALFNQAKLAYELSYDPFHEAIRALQNYLEKYPDSDRAEEAYEFLLHIYISTRNYDAALEALSQIENKSYTVRTAYQMVAYNQGVQLFQQRKFQQSLGYFAKTSDYPIDAKLNALAVFWMAEANYQLKDYTQAENFYKGFLKMPGSFTSGVYAKAYYGLGYCQFMRKEYNTAAINLRKYTESAKRSKRVNDAYLRIGDCYLVQKDYPLAVKYYRSALDIGQTDSDYGLYQLGLAYGLMRNEDQQAETFRTLVSDYPNSPLVVAARFQLGNTLMNKGKYSEALAEYDQIINNYSGNTYVRKALLQKGLIQYRQDNYNGALNTFKAVVEQFPTLADSKEAIARIEDIYVELGQIEDYNAWVSGLNFYDVSTTRLDSITFAAAETKYINGNCDAAIGAFQGYLEKYSGGIFALNANFYMAECLFENEKFDEALVGYNYVIDQPFNKFSEPALLAASSINYDKQQYQTALDQYAQLEKIAEFKVNTLEALIGQLRSNYKLGYYPQALVYADAVINSEGIPEDITLEAHLIKGKVLFETRQWDEAQQSLEVVHNASGGPEGAEAKYRLCQIDYEQGNYSEAEAGSFELIKEYPGYEFWKIKTLILLSDVYVALEDTFQAKAILQNIIKNASSEPLQNEAQEKLDAILAAEKAAEPDAEEDVMKLDVGDPSIDDKFFDQLEEEAEQDKMDNTNTESKPQDNEE